MASTYSSLNRLELIASGEKSGTWGDITNTNWQLLETAVDGYVSVAMADANTTLSTANGSTDQARNKVVEVTGAHTAVRDLIIPAAEKVYVVKNSTTGGFAVTVKVSGQTGATVPNGECRLLFCDGTTTYSTGNFLNTSVTAATSSLSPTTTDTVALGTTTLMWSDLFLASGGVVNWNNGDVTLTHSTNTLTFGGASSGYRFDASILPNTSDGAAIGSTTLMFSDLFLASGGVINWNNGNVLLTHSTGQLALTGSLTVSGTSTFTGAAALNGGGTLGDAVGDAVIIKGTTVSAFVAGLLSAADAAAFRTAIGLGDLAVENGPLSVAKGGTASTSAATGARTLLNGLGTTKGNIIYYNGSNWSALAPP